MGNNDDDFSDKNDSEKYKVGFRQPPRHSQFKPGRSGNPAGRPRGSKNLKTLLDQELSQRLVVTENGRRKRLEKRQIAVKNLVNNGLVDRRFMPLLLNFMTMLDERTEATSSNSESLDPADREIVENFLKRNRNGGNDGEH